MITASLGIGPMGLPIARRLAGQGCRVVAWNRSPIDEELRGEGVACVSGLSDAVAAAAMVVAALSDGPASLAVLGDESLRSHLPPDAIVADIGSNDPAMARALAERLGPGFVDAPVSGGPAGAAAGTLSIFLGADIKVADGAQDLLARLGRTTHVGPVGFGQAAKLASQVVVACMLAGLAESFAVAEALGVDRAVLRQAMEGGYADGRVLRGAGPRMVAGDFAARGRSSTDLKDLRNVAASLPPGAAEVLPAMAAAQGYLGRVLDDHGDLDHSAMLLVARQQLGSVCAAATEART